MDTIPKNEGEIFIELEEEPGYYLSNQERLFNLKLERFHKKQLNKYQELFQIHKHKYYIRHLMNKYFNEVQVDKLIPINKYGSYEFDFLILLFLHFLFEKLCPEADVRIQDFELIVELVHQMKNYRLVEEVYY